MKKYTALLLLLFISGVILWLTLGHNNTLMPSVTRPSTTGPERANSKSENTQPDSTTAPGKPGVDPDAIAEAAERAERLRDRKERLARADREYNTPITFYGMVLDEKNQPVVGATAVYACVDGSFDGERQTQSDASGRFIISGVRGKHLRVGVSHTGYYVTGNYWFYFYYAGTENGPLHIPDPAKPEIFRLRKKGEAAELIHQDDHILFTKEDGHARSFSLIDHTRRRDRPEYVILQGVETNERDQQGKPIRRLEMVVPEGGIQLRTDPFAFTAPTEGYQPSMYFMRPEFGGKLDYFVKFSTGNYGRFTIMGSAGDYLIDSYFNPDRSPNLEYDSAKEITVVRNGRPGVDLVYPAKSEPPPKP